MCAVVLRAVAVRWDRRLGGDELCERVAIEPADKDERDVYQRGVCVRPDQPRLRPADIPHVDHNCKQPPQKSPSRREAPAVVAVQRWIPQGGPAAAAPASWAN